MMLQKFLTPNAFFSVVISHADIASHPFVRRRVIPALEKTHPKQLGLLQQKYRKRWTDQKLSSAEFETRVWSVVLYDIVNHYTHRQGDDRSLSFGMFSGGDTYYVWDNLLKNFYPTDDFSFNLPLSKDSFSGGLYGNDGKVFLRGKLSTTIRNGERFSVFRVYFFVSDSSEDREPGATTISANVGILCEVPYFFLRSDRYNTFQDTTTTNRLLEMFELEKKQDDYMPPDFIPTDELGDMITSTSPIQIGNKYVSLWIR